MSTITSAEVEHFVDTVFGGLDDAVQELLERHLIRRVLAHGEVLWRAGEEAESIAFVVHGRLRVEVLEADGDWRDAGEIGRGQAIGVAEVVGRRARVGTVTAMRETELLLLSCADFERIVDRAPAFVVPMMRSLATRLGAALRGEQGFSAPETVAVVPLDPSVPLQGLVEALAHQLSRYVTVHAVDAFRVDNHFRPGSARAPLDGPHSEAIDRWLDDLDDRHEIDLYLADPEDTPWTRRCLQRADRIVLVAAAGADPAVRPFERLTDPDGPVPNRAHRELLLLHAAGVSSPRGTARWLEPRAVARLHHVRRGRDGDLARVARRLIGRCVGLVLSGGAARGMVHIGVIRALLEAGVPIDAVGGASAGGGVGVLLAADLSPDDMVAGITDAWLRSGVFSRPKIPLVSILESDKVREGVDRWLGERGMEDLWRDCYVVATNLTRARLEVIDRGPAWHAILATSAIPGLLPPALRGGDVLVDGGVLDNLPIAAMLRRNPGKVIASDVGDASDTVRADPHLEVCPSNASLLLERLNPFDTDTIVPWIGTTLFATVTCASRIRDPELMDDLIHYFHPDLAGLPALAFNDPEPLLAAGYRAGVAAIEAGAFASLLDPRPAPR
ncbi:MAG: patatin-like phospholipase family protein [Nannocystaceae bacterium]